MKEGWKSEKLGDVLTVIRGSSPRPIKNFITDDEDGVNWIKIGDVGENETFVTSTKQKITKLGAERSRFVDVGDFIFSNSMSFGRAYIMKIPGYIHDGWFSFKLPENIDQYFLWYLFKSPNLYNQIQKLASGAIVQNVSGDLIKKAILPIPPLPEQQKIVEILDTAFELIDQAKSNIEKNIQNAKELFQSKLNDVFSESQEKENYLSSTLSQLGTITSSKRIYKSEYVEQGIPFYRTKELKELANGREISLELFISNEKYTEIRERFGVPKVGDILVSAVGTIGEILVIENEDEFYFKDGNIIWFKEFNSVNPQYLKYLLKNFVEIIKSLAQGAAYSALTIEKINKYRVSIPKSLETQQKIVEQLDQISLQTELLQEKYTQKLANLEELKKSILEKAFKGELV